MTDDNKTVSVTFFTKDPSLKNPDVENTFNVPVTVTRFGLSEIVNHLLKPDKPTPFDFLINGIFVRSNLETFLKKHDISFERVVSVEYVEAQPAPKEVKSIPHDDWISSVSVISKRISHTNQRETDTQYVVSGCFDGVVRVIDMETFDIKATAQHPTAVKKVTTVPTFSNDNPILTIVTTCKDEFGRVWKYAEDSGEIKLDALLSGHSATAHTAEVNPTGAFACTGSWDKTIKIWDLTGKDNEGRAKKRRVGDDGAAAGTEDVEQQTAIGTLEGHNGVVSALAFGKAPNILFSASWDHSIRLWDIYSGISVSKMNGSKVTSELSVVQTDDTVLSGHSDFAVRLWDARVDEKVSKVFRSHKGMVRSVQWCPSHPYQFVTTADDSRMKLWDIRSSVPIHTLYFPLDAAVAPHVPHRLEKQEEQQVQVMTVRWASRRDALPERTLVTGDSNCQLRLHKIPKSVVEMPSQVSETKKE